MSIASRIINIISASAGKSREEIERAMNDGKSFLEKELDKWEEKLKNNKANKGSFNDSTPSKQPTQTEQDLAIFQLKFGASWEDVKKAHRRESRKYHSDFFEKDKGKQEISVEIMQIYNGAYERLKVYYGKK